MCARERMCVCICLRVYATCAFVCAGLRVFACVHACACTCLRLRVWMRGRVVGVHAGARLCVRRRVCEPRVRNNTRQGKQKRAVTYD